MTVDNLSGGRELAGKLEAIMKLEAVVKKCAMGHIIKWPLETEAKMQLPVWYER